MSVTPEWQSLSEVLRLLASPEVSEARAKDEPWASAEVSEAENKYKICRAIADLETYVRVEIHDAAGGDHAPSAFEKNEVEIPAGLTPNDFNWATSSPRNPWRTRRKGSTEWELRWIDLLQLCANDVRYWLCGEIDSVLLPEQKFNYERAPERLEHRRERWAEFQQGKWTPSEDVAAAVSEMAAVSEISLDDAVSLMAFGSRSAPAGLDRLEISARREQAGRTLCEAERRLNVRFFGSPTRGTGAMQNIPPRPWRLAGERNSIGPDYKPDDADIVSANRKLGRGFDQEWFDVRVNAKSFAEWLQEQVRRERWRELLRRHSRRVFEYPFWSVSTTICWIALRDADRLDVDIAALFSAAERDGDADSGTMESKPGVKLLEALQSGDLRALENGVSLPAAHWARYYVDPDDGFLLERDPNPGGLTPAAPSARFSRTDVLRVFPVGPPTAEGAKSESVAIKLLAERFKEKPDLKRKEAAEFLVKFKISGRRFQSWIWPEARGRAGLPKKGSPGPKTKSTT